MHAEMINIHSTKAISFWSPCKLKGSLCNTRPSIRDSKCSQESQDDHFVCQVTEIPSGRNVVRNESRFTS